MRKNVPRPSQRFAEAVIYLSDKFGVTEGVRAGDRHRP
jgi:hypothetical protein